MNQNKPILIIPDLHGELNLLLQVLSKFPEHNYVFLGDLVDRGPNSPEVVQEVIDLCKQDRAVLCLGNHEDMMIRGVKYGDDNLFSCWVSNGGDSTIQQYSKHRDNNSPIALPDHIDWLSENALQWVTIETPHGKILCSHASRPSPVEFLEVPPTENTYTFESDIHIWQGQTKYFRDLPHGYLCSVHGHVPQVKPKPYPKFVESPYGDFHLLDIGSFFNGRLAVLDTQDMSYHLFTKQEPVPEEQQ